MSVYFERKVSTTFGDVTTDISWYKDTKLAVALYSQDEGGYINIFNSMGGLIGKVKQETSKPVSCMSWHPRGSLFGAWDGGNLSMWSEDEGDNDIFNIESPHRATIVLLHFSLQGGRLITADTEGGLVGWSSGGRQLLTVFHHQLTDPISHVVFRNPSTRGLDLRGAAKAAVAGDQKALDLFTNLNMYTSWRPKTAGGRDFSFPTDFRDSQSFYATASSGVVFYVSENGRCQEVFDLGCMCRDILYRPEKDQLLALTDTMAVVQFNISPEGALEEIMKVKLSGGSRDVSTSMTWTKPGTVAINTGSTSIRLWNLDNGDNAMLSLPESAHQAEHFTAIAFCPAKGVVCGGTNAGNLLMWRHNDEDWDMESSSSITAPVKQLVWGRELLAVNTLTNLYILRQQPLSAHYNQQVGAVQTSGSHVVLLTDGSKKMLRCSLASEMQVYGVAVSAKYCLVWSDKTVVSYTFTIEQDALSAQVTGTFSCQCEGAAVYEESVVLLEKERATLRTIQGTIKQTFLVMPTEGSPIVLGLFSHYVTIATSEGFLKMWDISRREAKSHGRIKYLRDLIEDFGEVISAGCNSNGTYVAVTVAKDTLVPDSKLYVFAVESESVQWVDLMDGSTLGKEEATFTQNIADKLITSFQWDAEDPKLLVCHAKTTLSPPKEGKHSGLENCAVMFWISPDRILLHEIMPLTNQQTKLLACSTPNILMLSSQNADHIDKLIMGDFSGVAECNVTTRQAVLNFSYNLAIGNMDAAFKSINAVASESVWTNLAKNCVKSKRLDVATVCMGRIKNGRIAKALREAAKEEELEARVAILAVHVGMLDEAESLLKSCNRFDLLNKLYQTTGEWNKALQVAETHDRVHLRNTHHSHAKYLEHAGHSKEAVSSYEKADTHRIHAPRLLFDDPARLKSYIDQAGDVQMFKWMAQYRESTGDMESALHYYTLAKDHLSIVRVLCFLNNFHKASEVAQNSGDRAAAYHLARQLETMDRIDDALIFFTKAQTYGNAIRICKEQGLTDRIWSLALPATARDQADAARYLQEQGDTHKAILLYHKAGMVHKALDLAFSCDDTEALGRISSGLTGETDPNMLTKVAEYFISNQQYDRAVDILATAHKFSEAVALCVEHSVPLTEELAERLNPTGPDRSKLLMEIGECALSQDNYHLATKKFTQAGDKVRAMKALLKSGDTDKIIFLAGVSRDKEVYVMAANYLQALDWRSSPQLLNTVIQFYSKAKAYQALSNFYLACANVEVEEYQDYDKAVVALSEAKRCLMKQAEDGGTRKAVDTIDKRMSFVHQYLRARRAFDNGTPGEGVSLCRQLIAQLSGNDAPVRVGDVYGLMLENDRDLSSARRLFEEMRKVVPEPGRYLPSSLLDALGYNAKTQTATSLDDIGFEVQ